MRGSVKQDKEGKWFVIFDLGKHPETGKRQQKRKRGFKGEKEAEKYLREQLSALDKGTYFEPAKLSFAEFLNYWVENYAKPNTAPRTLEGYQYIITTHLIPSLGNIKLSNLQPRHLQEYYSKKLVNGKLDGGGLSPTSVKHHHRLIRKVLQDGVKWEFLAKNVADSVTPPKTKRIEMKIWSNEEIKTFLKSKAVKESVYFSVFITAIFTGMRRGEILALRWQDIDMVNNIIYVRQALSEVKGQGLQFKEPKSGKSRTISITTNLIEEFKKIQMAQNEIKSTLGSEYMDHGLVFAQKNGKPFQPVEMFRNFQKAIKLSGVPYIRFHDLRHTHASLMLQQGIHPKVVSERLGHSTIGITMDTYTHVLPNMQRDAALQFDQMFSDDSE